MVNYCSAVEKGDRIVLGWGNTIEFCQLFYAAVGLGIQVIPLSTKMKEFEGKEHLSCINADAVFGMIHINHG
ncbi:hypothetical protein J4731_02495 [Providencia rettgeri]|nr:hypothetical protein [Providencia rettgeri]